MFSKMTARMVERAMPGDLDDPRQEWIATEAAESAIRHTARIALLIGLLVLVLTGALVHRYYASRAGRNVAAVAPEALQQLSADNAKLAVQNQDLLKSIDRLTKERDALQEQLVDLAKKPQSADTAAAAGPPLASTEAAAAAKPAVPSKPVLVRKTPRSLTHVTAPKPAHAVTGGVRPAETFHCGDGRTVPSPALCTPARTAASRPASRLRPRPTYQCGDGRTAYNPAECRPRKASLRT